MRESGIHCPLCRGSVTRRERACPERALDLENIMRKFSGSCRCCSKKVELYYDSVLLFLVNMVLKRKTFPGSVVYTYNPCSQEAELGGLQEDSQFGLQIEIVSKTK